MEQQYYCSFCGKSFEDSSILLAGNAGHICPECLKRCNAELEKYESKVNDKTMEGIPKPKEIKEFLDQYIIGQDRVKERVAVAVYNHYKRINTEMEDDVEIEKSNILVLGATGTGKCICGNTKVKIRNKRTGEIYYDTINNLKKTLISSYTKE